MKKLLFVLIFLPGAISAFSQALNSVNFSHYYNPTADVSLKIHLVKTGSRMMALYTLQSAGGELHRYSILWEKRESFSQKEGTPIQYGDSLILETDKIRKGLLRVDIEEKPWILIAKVKDAATLDSWVYFQMIEKNYPVNGWMEQGNEIMTQNYLTLKKGYHFLGNETRPLQGTFYKQIFPAASPPFAEKEGKVDRFMFHDSTFTLSQGDLFMPRSAGLYLFQYDTSSAEGYSFRAVPETFPKFTKIEDLALPLLYVCTQDEFSELVKSGNDKVKFDKVILGITKDRERAKNFMRSYFQRVELANQYFSSYKEGWKTDRGMIYIIFGLPDEINMNGGTQTWLYKSQRVKFTFVKSGSVYDPGNYVLVRDKRFMEPWFSIIDLWRKSRF